MCLFRFKAQITEPSPEYAQWLSTVKNVNEIIQFANDFTYISDKEQFGKTDHWQTPSEFFKNKREVILKEGQVLFEIAKDKNRPFIITAGKTLIEVVGTKFEVKNIENITTISVEEGLVKVDFIRHLLLPTQEITLLKKSLS